MTKKFIMEVVTPARKVLSVEVDSVIVPASTGYLGILVNHAPLVTSLGVGVLKYKGDGKEEYAAVCGGFMEVSNNKVSIMADAAECAFEIDMERAKRAEERARERLKRKDGIDTLRAELALRRAMARMQAARLR
ncbi:F0F1 ATP synthase subunit epsilon [Desulfitibacter alkalitolerans]|uniref:F0F1 ATP synthase subunit epsilon n=1 Tax=Desulfitibacter alkalitolerans TaxID=264641 RepID=UPI0004875BF9|nr:F0F1 ATP synthase subunit epsilon [Desulfitibacter alkalitolerans]